MFPFVPFRFSNGSIRLRNEERDNNLQSRFDAHTRKEASYLFHKIFPPMQFDLKNILLQISFVAKLKLPNG